jgi:hypothetical protein
MSARSRPRPGVGWAGSSIGLVFIGNNANCPNDKSNRGAPAQAVQCQPVVWLVFKVMFVCAFSFEFLEKLANG